MQLLVRQGERFVYLFLIVLVVLVIPSCAKVKVNVNSCGPGFVSTGADLGGCNPPTPWNGSATGFKKTDGTGYVQESEKLSCTAAGSSKCQETNPGRCGLKKCINWYRPSDSWCECNCP